MGRIAVAAVVSLWAIPISILVNRIVPDPYMDEIFHVPQAQRYCRGDFTSWDPMITTPPGLYYLSLAYVASLFPGMWFAKAVQSFSLLCSTTILRSTNAVFAIICSILVYDLLILLRPTMSERKATLYAIVLTLYPVHWFFTFLYYTDVASLTAVLAMYMASLKEEYWVSAMVHISSDILMDFVKILLFIFARTGILPVYCISCVEYININALHALYTNLFTIWLYKFCQKINKQLAFPLNDQELTSLSYVIQKIVVDFELLTNTSNRRRISYMFRLDSRCNLNWKSHTKGRKRGNFHIQIQERNTDFM